jgi:hypothetical protein
MSDTPRTDEISRGYLSVPVEWAKTLERELAEAREIAEMQKETMRQMREQYGIGERNVMRELRQQRDTLAEALKIIASDGKDQFRWSLTKAVSLAKQALAAVKGGDA